MNSDKDTPINKGRPTLQIVTINFFFLWKYEKKKVDETNFKKKIIIVI